VNASSLDQANHGDLTMVTRPKPAASAAMAKVSREAISRVQGMLRKSGVIANWLQVILAVEFGSKAYLARGFANTDEPRRMRLLWC
jgi:hypothetical protein